MSSFFNDKMLIHNELMKQITLGPLSLNYFTTSSKIRKICIKIMQNWFFDHFIIINIILNCIFMSFDDGSNNFPISLIDFINYSEIYFLMLFTIEMMIKIIALGLYNNGSTSYLRDNWNILDFIVVLFGYLNYLPNIKSITVIRALRVLRPLRAIKSIPGMRIVIESILSALPGLLDVLIVFIMLLFLFGMIGMQLYGGKLSYRCYDNDNPEVLFTEADGRICSLSSNYGYQCPIGSFCKDSHINPNNNVTSFDNIFISWLTILQCISLEGWVDIMYYVFDISSKWNVIYFILLVIFGAFFVVNLATAVIFIRFDQTKTLHQQKMLQSKQEATLVVLQRKSAANTPIMDTISRQSSLSSTTSSSPLFRTISFRADLLANEPLANSKSNEPLAAPNIPNLIELNTLEKKKRRTSTSSRKQFYISR